MLLLKDNNAVAAIDAAWPALVQRAQADEPDDCPLWRLYAPIAQADQIVVGQLGQSLDGRVATATGKSRYINGPQAIRHLHRLRALVDAVIVGVGTAIADDPQLTVREVAGPSPARVVIDPHFRLPADLRMVRDGAAPVYAVQARPGARNGAVEPIVAPAREGAWIAPADILAALRARGLRRVLVEGGAATVSAFLAAGALDRLHLSVAPMVIGSGPVGLNLPPIDELSGALRPRSTPYLLDGDIVFDCAFENDR